MEEGRFDRESWQSYFYYTKFDYYYVKEDDAYENYCEIEIKESSSGEFSNNIGHSWHVWLWGTSIG